MPTRRRRNVQDATLILGPVAVFLLPFLLMWFAASGGATLIISSDPDARAFAGFVIMTSAMAAWIVQDYTSQLTGTKLLVEVIKRFIAFTFYWWFGFFGFFMMFTDLSLRNIITYSLICAILFAIGSLLFSQIEENQQPQKKSKH